MTLGSSRLHLLLIAVLALAPVPRSAATDLRAPARSRPPGADRVGAPAPGSSPGAVAYVGTVPEPIHRVRPICPRLARQAGVHGTVLVQVLVRKDGSVGPMRVLRSIPMLDQAALDAARQWRFRPAIHHGRPVAMWVTIPFRFVAPPVLL